MLLTFFKGGLFKIFSTLFIAVMPFIEAKGAIPIGMGIGLNPAESFVFSFIGSMLPVPILLTLIVPFLNFLNKKTKYKKLYKNINNYVLKKTQKFKKKQRKNLGQSGSFKSVKLLTLFTFVALPFPGTGVWSGSVVAGVMNVNKKRAFLVIALGNLFASGIIFLLSLGILN